MENKERQPNAYGEGETPRTPGVTGAIDMRTRDAALINRALTQRPKWNIPEAKRKELLEAGFEAVDWARESRDANAVGRLLGVFRSMEADNDRVELKREEWDRLDAGKVTSRSEVTGGISVAALIAANPDAVEAIEAAVVEAARRKELEGQ